MGMRLRPSNLLFFSFFKMLVCVSKWVRKCCFLQVLFVPGRHFMPGETDKPCPYVRASYSLAPPDKIDMVSFLLIFPSVTTDTLTKDAMSLLSPAKLVALVCFIEGTVFSAFCTRITAAWRWKFWEYPSSCDRWIWYQCTDGKSFWQWFAVNILELQMKALLTTFSWSELFRMALRLSFSAQKSYRLNIRPKSDNSVQLPNVLRQWSHMYLTSACLGVLARCSCCTEDVLICVLLSPSTRKCEWNRSNLRIALMPFPPVVVLLSRFWGAFLQRSTNSSCIESFHTRLDFLIRGICPRLYLYLGFFLSELMHGWFVMPI